MPTRKARIQVAQSNYIPQNLKNQPASRRRHKIGVMLASDLLSWPDDEFLRLMSSGKPLVIPDPRSVAAIRERLLRLTGGRCDLVSSSEVLQ
jgi:hypothetical protein